MRKLSREPAHVGDVYCSPQCGFNCKRVAYERCVKEADDLCRQLGEGWTPEVWENCGWNWAVYRGIVHIHQSRRGSGISGEWELGGFRCYIQTSPQFVASGETAQEAFRNALAKMQECFDDLSASVGTVKGYLE